MVVKKAQKAYLRIMDVKIIIGKSFGDEGKGLATDHFAGSAFNKGEPCLVIRHNGGAQAGHTVDLPAGRFVFRQLSSGSFRRADTLWADTFLPDLYKLPEELAELSAAGCEPPRLLSFGGCRCVIIDDVLLNMALETVRGSNRHGSCGMGINEAVQRSANPEFALTLGKVKGMSCDSLVAELRRIRSEYLPRRLDELGLGSGDAGEYGELLSDESVLHNAAQGMLTGAQQVELIEPKQTEKYGAVIFEGAQGLLLDEYRLEFAPHLTTSRTGLHNPMDIMGSLFTGERAEAVYVTRSYVTRHGNGRLPHEGEAGTAELRITDLTNVPNEWQGRLRLAPHGSAAEFLAPVLEDSDGAGVSRSLMITHLNETDGRILTVNGALTLGEFRREYHIDEYFDRLYISYSRFSEEIICHPEQSERSPF